MADFFLHHGVHGIRLRPHAFTDLCFALQAAFEANVHVGIFVRAEPRLCTHEFFTHHCARVHAGVNFVAGAIHEAGVDEDYAVFGFVDTLFQIHGGAALFVHDADFHAARGQVNRLLSAAKQFNRKCHFFRAVHFWFHDVHAAGT